MKWLNYGKNKGSFPYRVQMTSEAFSMFGSHGQDQGGWGARHTIETTEYYTNKVFWKQIFRNTIIRKKRIKRYA